MRTIFWVATALAMGAVPAGAQTTSCGMELGRWVCHQQPGINWATVDPNAAFNQGYDSVDRVMRDIEARERAAQQNYLALQAQQGHEQQQQAVSDARSLRMAVGQFVIAGKCQEARNLALNSGELSLAGDVDRVCRPAAP